MALEDIFRALDEQADEECERILQEARDHAAMIVADAEQQAEGVRQAHVGEVERVARAKASQVVNAARLEARKRVAAVKQAAIEHAFARSGELLGGVRSSATYPQLFESLAREALAGVQGEATIEVDPTDEELARATLVRLGTAGEVKADISTAGGLVVNTSGGRIIRRDTLEDRLEKVRELDQAQVAEHMFS